jgi:endonuclease/exonuclease/phosphatase family metal-dependent hydrolase
VFLEEVDRVQHIADIKSALERDQNIPFYFVSVNRDGNASGASNLAVISAYPIENVRATVLGTEGEVICGVSTAARSAIGGEITIDGKSLAIFAVRTYWESTSCVAREHVRRLKSWAATHYSGLTQVYGGDFNMSPGSDAYNAMKNEAPACIDSWDEAVKDKTATAETTPSFTTPTRSSRLDYIFYRNADTKLSLKSSEIFPITSFSDHRPFMAIFDIL